MTCKAFAKVNLFLDVVAKRDDGFHNIKSVMQTVSLCDEISMTFSESEILRIRISSNVEALNGPNNLIYKAIELYFSKCGFVASVDVELVKNIPLEAGLGGGSSDAAAVLRLLNREFRFLSEAEMLRLAALLGSDVPFLYVCGTALCEGRGEIISPMKCGRLLHFVIAVGEDRISTPSAYSRLDTIFSDFDGSVEDEDLAKAQRLRFEIQSDLIEFPVYNIFEKAIPEDVKIVTFLKKRLIMLGATHALMSGSGPAVFGVFDDESTAKKAEADLKKDNILAFYAYSV